MITVLIVNLIAILILIFSNQIKTKNNLMPGVILLLAIFYSIRYDFGNDYSAYNHVFTELNSRSNRYIAEGYLGDIEIGWRLLNQFIGHLGLGFEALVVVETFFQFSVMGWFIMKMVPRKYQWQALAVYLFTPGFMVSELSMMRQMMAMSFLMLALPYIVRKRFIPAILLISCGVLFHKSAVACYVLIPLVYLRKVNYKWAMAGYLILVTSTQFLAQPLVDLTYRISSYDTFGKYEYYLDVDNQTVEMRSGLGFIFQLLMMLYIAYMLKYKNTKYRYFILCLLLGYSMTPITGSIGIAGRIILYYQQAGILGFLPLFKRARKDAFSMIVTIVYIVYLASANYIFFTSEVYTKKFMHYHTLLEF